uniref:Uncharacterized protein n=1 Tax=Steinernema glaseri TaxID=37863 RepID=A0A1I7YL80_9BILA
MVMRKFGESAVHSSPTMARSASIRVHRRGTTTASEARTAQRHTSKPNCLTQQPRGFSIVNGDDDRCKRTNERCHSRQTLARSN